MRGDGRWTAWLTIGLVLAAAEPGHAQERPFWGGLEPGPHPVGFETRWTLDRSRVYDTRFADGSRYAGGADAKAPRPVLVNTWYPAAAGARDAPRMTHGDYLELASEDLLLAKLGRELAAYARQVIVDWALDPPEGELDGWSSGELARLLATPTACARDAPPAAGPFPLVVYHSGYQSSYEDNAVWCEYLASHGYVVVGSAFLCEDGSSFNIDGKAGSARDIGFLIDETAAVPFVDWSRVGVAGHSGGAHAALEYQAWPTAAVDAVISLDTTQDYVSALDPHWRHTGLMLAAVEHQTAPILAVAKPHAFFQALDTLVHAERYYLTFRDLDHNDYTLQGVWTAEVAAARAAAGGAENAAELAARTAVVRRGFEECTEYARLFLDAHLKRDAGARAELASRYRGTPLAGEAPHVEHAPVGAGGPAYDPASGVVATPREAFALLANGGAEALVGVMERFREAASDAPVYHNQFSYGVLYELVATGREEDARVFAELVRELHPDLGTSFVWWAERDAPGRYPEFYRNALTAALLIDPGNEEWERKLAEVEAR